MKCVFLRLKHPLLALYNMHSYQPWWWRCVRWLTGGFGIYWRDSTYLKFAWVISSISQKVFEQPPEDGHGFFLVESNKREINWLYSYHSESITWWFVCVFGEFKFPKATQGKKLWLCWYARSQVKVISTKIYSINQLRHSIFKIIVIYAHYCCCSGWFWCSWLHHIDPHLGKTNHSISAHIPHTSCQTRWRRDDDLDSF